MIHKNVAANAGDIEERQFACQESAHRRFIGGVEDRSTSSAAARHLVSQL
jgi:hypothetical protein